MKQRKKPEGILLISLLLALNGMFIAGYITSFLSYEALTLTVFLRLLPELVTMVMAFASAYGLWKMSAWGYSSAVLTIGMITYSVLNQLREYSSFDAYLIYGVLPLGLITAVVYFWRRRIFLLEGKL